MQASVRQEYDTVYVDADDGYVHHHTLTTPHHTSPHHTTPSHTSPHHTTPSHTTPHLANPVHTTPHYSHHAPSHTIPSYLPPFTRQISEETNAEVEIPRDPHLQNKLSQGTHSPVSHTLKSNKHTPSRRALNWHTYVCTVLHCVPYLSCTYIQYVCTYVCMYARMYVCTCIRTCIQHVMKPYLVTYVSPPFFSTTIPPSPPPLTPLSPPLLTSISPPPIIPLFPFSPPLSTVLRPTAGQSRARQPSLMSSVSRAHPQQCRP